MREYKTVKNGQRWKYSKYMIGEILDNREIKMQAIKVINGYKERYLDEIFISCGLGPEGPRSGYESIYKCMSGQEKE